MGVNSYPAEPWRLNAHAFVGVSLIRAAGLPLAPPGTKPISIFGRAIVSMAFFVYEEPSPLTYHEVMATRLVRRGLRPCVNILHIWVDSEASRDGGRALWAIPKDLADFEVTPGVSYDAHTDTTTIGSLRVGRITTLPLRVPFAFRIAQERENASLLTRVRARGGIGLATARWSFNPDGPLGYLAGQKRLATISLKPLRLVFGS